MQQAIAEQCARLTENYQILRKCASAEHEEVILAAAGIVTAAERTADPALYEESLAVLKSCTNVLSEYRGTGQFITVCKMAVSGDPAQYFSVTDSIYRTLHPKAIGSESAITAAMILADSVQAPEDCGILASRTLALYRRMKGMHRFLTDEYDLPFAAVMAVTGRNHDAIMGDAEACFSILKSQKFAESNAIQSLSHVLALYPGSAADKCALVTELRAALKAAGHPYPAGGRLAMLGTMAGLGEPAAVLAEMIAEADDYLAAQECFSHVFSSPGTDARRMYAVQAAERALMGKDSGSAMLSASLSAAIAEAVMLWLVLMTAAGV